MLPGSIRTGLVSSPSYKERRPLGRTEGEQTDSAVIFLMIVVGTVLAPDQTGLLKRSLRMRSALVYRIERFGKWLGSSSFRK